MPFVKLQFRPGIVRDTTRYANSGGWYDCDKVRFRAGLPEKIGGWTRYSTSAFVGSCRHLRTFRTLDGVLRSIIGTHQRVYLERGGDLYELTPWDAADTGLSNPFTTTSGSAEIQVTKSAHGRSVGDRIDITGASDTGGIPASDINGVRTITTIVNNDTYKFTAGSSATTSTTGGGGSVNIYYLYPDGLDAPISGSGWGSGGWGEGTWGTPGPPITGDSRDIRTWSSDNFGEDVFMCAWNGNLFYWDATNGESNGATSRPVPLSSLAGASGTPSVARFVMVSQRDRHAFAFGCDSVSNPGVQDPLLIRWSDAENIADWTRTSTNTAGSLLIGSGSAIMAAQKTRQEILVWTDTDLHSLQYVGGEFTFGIELLARNTSIIGRNAAVTHLGVAYWMGNGAFFVYDGQVRDMRSPVEDYVFQDFNYDNAEKVMAAVFADQSEIIWFYPSAASTECDRYVIYNMNDDAWYFGTMSRTAWADAFIYDKPIAAGTDGYIYSHEDGELNGETSPPSQIIAYIESSPMEIGDGYQFSFVDRVIPDVTFRNVGSGATPSVTMTLKSYRNPGSAQIEADGGAVTRTATTPIEQFTEDVWVRLRGRAISLRIEDTVDGIGDFGWRLGLPRIQIRSDGRK